MTNLTRIVTLTNGKKVANFSSPHEFKFEDGTILPAVSPEYAEKLKVNFHETDIGGGDILLDFSLSAHILIDIAYWQDMYLSGLVNVVYCPLPMMQALKERIVSDPHSLPSIESIKDSPFRSIRIEDRIKRLVSINKQCI